MIKDFNLAIVDVETTGSTPNYSRVMEIGILVVEKGKVVDSFKSFINPESRIPPYIESLTGISQKDVEHAPLFDEVKNRVYDMLQGRIFVAHNARFDFGFVKNEFKRVGMDFRAQMLCTVKLSRKLYPHERRHSLDKLIERFGFSCENRHRAFDDAKILWDFLERVQKDIPSDTLAKALESTLRIPTLPKKLNPTLIEGVPQTPGVYIFYSDTGKTLYVGKSIHLRDRILSHFSADHTGGSKMAMCQQIADIEILKTAGELGALLLESHLIKKMQPLFNRRSRSSKRLTVFRKTKTKEGYDTVELDTLAEIKPDDLKNIWGIFRTQKQAKDCLQEKIETYRLCSKLLGLDKSQGRCFDAQIKKCDGACEGRELPIRYNMRFMEAFNESRIRAWPYPGPVVIQEADESGNEGEAFLVDQWCLVANAKFTEQTQHELTKGPYVFDYDSYKILLGYLSHPKNKKSIRPFHPEAAEFRREPVIGGNYRGALRLVTTEDDYAS